jgi:hypothetical protein
MGTLSASINNNTGATIGLAIVRQADGLVYDFASNTFVASDVAIQPIGQTLGLIGTVADPQPTNVMNLSTTVIGVETAQFPDGNYEVTYHNMNASNAVIGSTLTATVASGTAIVA